MYRYIEIVEYSETKNKVVKRIDVTGKSSHMIDVIESGVNRNLNHEKYFTKEVATKKERKII